MIRPLFLFAAMLFCTAAAHSETQVPITNPGFEEELTGWTVLDGENLSATVSSDAANEGNNGLRVEDDSDTSDVVKVTSSPIAVSPGKPYRLSFQARTHTPHCVGVFIRFLKPDGEMLGEEHRPYQSVDRGDGMWVQYVIETAVPENANSVVLLIASYSKMRGEVDLDDFSLEEMPASSAAGGAPAIAPGLAKSGRDGPAKIIIKADDLRAHKGGIHPKWMRFIDIIKDREIKASIGIICDSLEEDNPRYFQAIKDLHASGRFEFWNHGYDHRSWEEDGKKVFEFQGSPYALQLKHFTRSNELAREKLGLVFRTFAPPFNVTDEHTAKILAEDQEIKIWIFGDKNRPAGKIILDRLWDVTIENPNFVPNLQKLKDGYASHPDRDYFVIQCHPATWDDGRFEEFVRIVDFLIAEGVVFVTPVEYCGIEATTTI